MLFYTGLVFLVIAVSLDGFGVGMTYGLRKIRVPLSALSIIMIWSGIVVFVSMAIGDVLSQFITPRGAEIFGGLIFIGLGLFSLWTSYAPAKENNKKAKSDLGKVLSSPEQADLDGSGTISRKEAFILGLALALDAFGAGIGASMFGYPALLTAILVASMSGLFLFLGIRLGLLMAQSQSLKRLKFIPPILLILLGLFNIF